jgi:hypothetical protein
VVSTTRQRGEEMTYEQKKAQAIEIIKDLRFGKKVTPEYIFGFLESIGMVFLDDEQELPIFIGAEMSSQYEDIKEGYLEAQQDMLNARFVKVLEAGK